MNPVRRRVPATPTGPGWRWLAGLLGSALAMVAGCSTPGTASTESVEPPPRHRNWWNYYERGLVHLQEGNNRNARFDFETALGIRHGARAAYDVDHWRVRTYGMHVREMYFPNRELGVAAYRLGDLADAERFLLRSLSQAASGRARYYLNQVHRQQLRGVSVAPPTIDFDSTSSPAYTRLRRFQARGTARAPGRIHRLSIQGQEPFIELAELEREFDLPLPLQSGTNRLALLAEDLTGQRTRREWIVVADWRPPQLSFRTVEAGASGWLVEGVFRDDQGLRLARAAGVDVTSPGAPPGPRDAAFQVRIPRGGKAVEVMAEDHAGNRLRRSLREADFVRWQVNHVNQMWASTAPTPQGEPRTIHRAEPVVGDRVRPRLRLAHADRIVHVLDDEFLLEGTAEDAGGLRQVFVNGEPQLVPSDEVAIQQHFASRLPLDVGTNAFDVLVLDYAGNRTQETLHVVRRVPEYLDESLRLTVGVPPPAAAETDALPEIAHRTMEQELLREPARFHLLERSEGWDLLLREQALSRSDLADPAAALRIKKLLPAELLVMSGFSRAEGGLTVYARVVQTADGRVLCLEDVYTEKPEQDLADRVSGLILKIEQNFPVVDGTLASINRGRVELDVGAHHGIRSGTRFVVIQPDAPPASAGDVCRVEGAAVELEVDRVRETTSFARVVPPQGKGMLKSGDRIYTR